MPLQQGRRSFLVAALFYTAVFLASNQLLLRGKAIPIWDASSFYAPAQILVADHARNGSLVLWNPWMNGGRPDCADPQVGAFSPINVIIGLLTGGSLAGFLFYWLFVWWLAGIGILLLGRHLGVPAWGACAAAMVYYTSGFFITNAEHTTFVLGMAFLPWIVWRLDFALTRGSRLAAGQAGAIWGLSALAGYPGLVALTGFFLGLWTTGRVLTDWQLADSAASTQRSFWTKVRTAAVCWSIFLLVGVLELAPTYIAFFSEGEAYSDRVDYLTKEVAVGSNALHPGALTTFASPYLAILKLLNRDWWSYTDPSMTSIYIHLGFLGLALAALWHRPRRSWRWWLAGVAVFFLIAAMGRALPLRSWLYDWFIPMRFFRHSAIFRGYFIFSMVVLAMYAIRDLAQAAPALARGRWARLSAVTLAFGVAAVAILYFLGSQATKPGPLFPVAMKWILFVVAGTALGSAVGAIPRRWGLRVVPWLLVAMCAADAVMTIRISRWVLQSTNLKTWRQVMAAHSAEIDLTSNGLDRLAISPFGQRVSGRDNRNLVSKQPTLQNEDPFRNLFLSRWVSFPELRDMALGPERIWFSPRAASIEPTKSAYFMFEKRARSLGVPPLVVSHGVNGSVAAPFAEMLELGSLEDGVLERLEAMKRMAVDVESYRPNELSFSFEAPSAGWILVTDRYAAGWKAWVDGEQQPIYRGNFIFRALEVSGGIHRVTFRYRPRGFPGLLMISWGLMAIIAIGSFPWVRWRLSALGASGSPPRATVG